jgi:hypothetical protein
MYQEIIAKKHNFFLLRRRRLSSIFFFPDSSLFGLSWKKLKRQKKKNGF